MFVNRQDELAALERWWKSSGSSLGIVWGRRRVGKTALLGRVADDKLTVFHTAAARPLSDELDLLSRSAEPALSGSVRDLGARPFADWDDALDSLAAAAGSRRLLVVLDEFPELVRVSPELPAIIRAFWDRVRSRTKLKLLLCGSAVRTMQAMQEERSPLYGRFDLSLLLHPFRPHEAAEMLPRLSPEDRALVWGVVGGVPLYLEWWDQSRSIRANLRELVCTPGGALLNEGQLVLATEGDAGDLAMLTLRAIAAGRTKHNEIEQAVASEPARVLERLVELRMVERLSPVTENPRRTRKRLYRIADNFLLFWLSVVDQNRAAIERGLGSTVLSSIVASLDDHMGDRWEAAFRDHLVRLAARGDLGKDIVDVGRWWTDSPPVEIDAVALAGRSRTPVLAGEAKWTRRVNGERLVRSLADRAARLPRASGPLDFAICARDVVDNPSGALAITARDIFS